MIPMCRQSWESLSSRIPADFWAKKTTMKELAEDQTGFPDIVNVTEMIKESVQLINGRQDTDLTGKMRR